MAYQKLVFLVTLMLVMALSCQGEPSKKCSSEEDCPICGFGVRMCFHGVCKCNYTNPQLKADDAEIPCKKCKLDEDCPICGFGVRKCLHGVCKCVHTKQEVRTEAGVRNCELAVDCPPCRIGYRQCVDGVCSCIPTNHQLKPERNCQYDTDCAAGCDPKCYHFCEDSTCYCDCAGK